MFELKRKTNYGLEVMIALAKNFEQGPLSLKKIAKDKNLSYKFLEQVVVSLKEKGLVRAREGRAGGYFLKKDPREISVAEIIESLEGPMEICQCSHCSLSSACQQKNFWLELRRKIEKTIEQKTLANLI